MRRGDPNLAVGNNTLARLTRTFKTGHRPSATRMPTSGVKWTCKELWTVPVMRSTSTLISITSSSRYHTLGLARPVRPRAHTTEARMLAPTAGGIWRDWSLHIVLALPKLYQFSGENQIYFFCFYP